MMNKHITYLNIRCFKTYDAIIIFDGTENSYKAKKITSINKNKIMGNTLFPLYKVPDFIVKVYTLIPKGNRFEWLMEKCAKIGIFEIVPIILKRSVNTSFSKKQARTI